MYMYIYHQIYYIRYLSMDLTDYSNFLNKLLENISKEQKSSFLLKF